MNASSEHAEFTAAYDPDDEDMYNDVTDELNDGNPGDMQLGDLNEDWVAGAARYARARGLSWPPERGDWDRQYDWLTERRGYLARLEDQEASEKRWAAEDAAERDRLTAEDDWNAQQG